MKNIRVFLCLTLLFLLSSCMEASCIDADDFGFSQVNVSANYTEDQIHGSADRQYVDWYDSGLVLSGDDILAVVRNWDPHRNINTSSELSAWCPWFGPSKYPPSLQDICILLDQCLFDSDQICSQGKQARILNAPCILSKGIGLYMMIAPKGFDPNENQISNLFPMEVDPRVVIKHLGDKQYNASGEVIPIYDLQIDPSRNSSFYSPAGGVALNLTDQQKQDLRGGKIFFKFQDSYYGDNSGQYIVQVKKGVTSNQWDPMDFAVKLVKNFFFGSDPNDPTEMYEPGAIKQIFNNVIKNNSYKLLVSSLLTAYIIFYAFNFLIGNVKVTQQDFIARVVKILVISQLLVTDRAWDFFNNNFFDYFISGSESLINLIKNTGGAGPGPSSIIEFMLSPYTIIKLSSLPLFSWANFGWSILYTILYIITLFILFGALFYSAMIYIVCVVMIGLIISLAPIFLCFILFDNTRSLFENWLKQLLSYSLQSIIVVAGITMLGIMIKHQIYQTVGFRVCKYNYLGTSNQNAMDLTTRGDSGRRALPYIWKPIYAAHADGVASSEQLTKILVPEAHYQTENKTYVGSNQGGIFCKSYECIEERYPSFPFLDPNSSIDMRKLRSFWAGDFTPMDGILVLILTTGLMLRFLMSSTKIGQFLTGGTFGISKAVNQSAKTVGMSAGYATKFGLKYGGKASLFVAKKAVKVLKKIRSKNGSGGEGGDSVGRK